MKKFFALLAILELILLSVVVLSCDHDNKSSRSLEFVGTWENSDGDFAVFSSSTMDYEIFDLIEDYSLTSSIDSYDEDADRILTTVNSSTIPTYPAASNIYVAYYIESGQMCMVLRGDTYEVGVDSIAGCANVNIYTKQ